MTTFVFLQITGFWKRVLTAAASRIISIRITDKEKKKSLKYMNGMKYVNALDTLLDNLQRSKYEPLLIPCLELGQETFIYGSFEIT